MTDALLLAPAYIADDYTLSDLLTLAHSPTNPLTETRGNVLRRLRTQGLIHPYGLHLSGRAYRALEDADGFGLGRRTWDALQAGFRGSVVDLATMLGELDASGEPSRALEHVVEDAVEAGWLLPVRAVRLTAKGRRLVRGCPEAMEIAEAERRARKAARAVARLTADEARALEQAQRPDPVVLLAQATRGAPVLRARPAEGREVRGVPTGRTVPGRYAGVRW